MLHETASELRDLGWALLLDRLRWMRPCRKDSDRQWQGLFQVPLSASVPRHDRPQMVETYTQGRLVHVPRLRHDGKYRTMAISSP